MERKGIGAKWEKAKPWVYGFIIGLIVGPFVSSYLGWQVLSSTAKQDVAQAVVQQEANVCNMLARQQVKDPSTLDYNKQEKLAEKYSKLPWDNSGNYQVVSACQDALARKAPAAPATAKG